MVYYLSQKLLHPYFFVLQRYWFFNSPESNYVKKCTGRVYASIGLKLILVTLFSITDWETKVSLVSFEKFPKIIVMKKKMPSAIISIYFRAAFTFVLVATSFSWSLSAPISASEKPPLFSFEKAKNLFALSNLVRVFSYFLVFSYWSSSSLSENTTMSSSWLY